MKLAMQAQLPSDVGSLCAFFTTLQKNAGVFPRHFFRQTRSGLKEDTQHPA
jgi:hypothetical protein